MQLLKKFGKMNFAKDSSLKSPAEELKQTPPQSGAEARLRLWQAERIPTPLTQAKKRVQGAICHIILGPF